MSFEYKSFVVARVWVTCSTIWLGVCSPMSAQITNQQPTPTKPEIRTGDWIVKAASRHKKMNDYFGGEWKFTTSTDGKTESGTMRVAVSPDGNGHLVTQNTDSGKTTGLFGFDSANGCWCGQWQTAAGIYGREVFSNQAADSLKPGGSFLSVQQLSLNGQPGSQTWLYEINSRDKFAVSSKNSIVGGNLIPETKMKFTHVSGKSSAGASDNSMPESAAARAWRDFLVGDWSRNQEVTVDGTTTKRTIEWTCKAAGNAIVSYSTKNDQAYATVMAWVPERPGLVEAGHSDLATWEIVYTPKDSQSCDGINTGHLTDGRIGKGTTVVKRTGDNSYTAETVVRLDDGSTLHAFDRNARR